MIAHSTTATPTVHVPDNLADAVELLRDGEAEVLAGGTWVMRGEIQGYGFSPSYVLVANLPELNRLEFTDDGLVIGANVTHDRLAAFLFGDPRFEGLHKAAKKSANPAIRRMATLGGNLSTINFEAADLPPALLAASAQVALVGADGSRTMSLAEFLPARASLLPRTLITHVTVPIPRGLTVHERLTMRKAGDYPMAIVHLHVVLADDGTVSDATVALGSVEQTPRLWPELAAALVGSELDPESAAKSTKELEGSLNARDGVEAAGWYRLRLLQALVKRAVHTLQRKAGSR